MPAPPSPSSPAPCCRPGEPHAAIIVEPGGRIVAEGTREAPVVLTCSVPAGYRQPGCWAGLRILGQAPVTRLEGVAPGVLPPERPAYGGSGREKAPPALLRYVRVEFAGASGDPEAPGPAIGLYGAGSGTLLDHVQARASLGDGFAFSRWQLPPATTAWPAARAARACPGSAAGRAGAAHLYVQHGRGGGDGLSGGHDPEGHDREPRSLPDPVQCHAGARRALRPAHAAGRSPCGLPTAAPCSSATCWRPTSAAGRCAPRAARACCSARARARSQARLLWLNGSPQVPAGIAEDADFAVRNPKLRDVRDFADPDPRPKADSPALTIERKGYIGAFGRTDNWLKEWTVFGPESVYDMRQRTEDEN